MRLDIINFEKYLKISFYISIFIFFLGVLAGIIIGPHINKLDYFGQEVSFYSVSVNNLKVSFYFLTIGMVTGGIYAFLFMGINGYIIGKLIQYLYINNELNILYKGLLPHFFIELLGLATFSMISTIPIIVILLFFKTPTHVVPIKKIIKLSVFFTVLGIVLIIIGGYIESNISYVDIR